MKKFKVAEIVQIMKSENKDFEGCVFAVQAIRPVKLTVGNNCAQNTFEYLAKFPTISAYWFLEEQLEKP